eukprot:COSAG06_NODE_755_length_12532_cov_10.124990_3_plen_88_part_00
MCCGVGKLLSSRDAPQELLGSGAHGNPKSRAQELSRTAHKPAKSGRERPSSWVVLPLAKELFDSRAHGTQHMPACELDLHLTCCMPG